MEDYFKHFFDFDKLRNEKNKSELDRCKHRIKEYNKQKNKYSRLAFDQIKENKRFKTRCVTTFTMRLR